MSAVRTPVCSPLSSAFADYVAASVRAGVPGAERWELRRERDGSVWIGIATTRPGPLAVEQVRSVRLVGGRQRHGGRQRPRARVGGMSGRHGWAARVGASTGEAINHILRETAKVAV